MKKILISILIILLLALCCVSIIKGISIGSIEILGISQIKEANSALDSKISEATVLASTDYKNILDTINTDIKKLQEEKKNYDDMVTISTDEEVKIANQYQKYEIEYLWTTIGNHATKEGVIIKMDIASGNGTNVYNLNFTVNGSYIGTTEFISDIENDSALGFKIENFSMKPGSSSDSLETTFTCKDITIKDINKTTTTNNKTTNNDETNSEKETNDNESNTTNTTNTSNNTNSTNTTNTANTNNTTSNTNTSVSINSIR